jgi:hypothetical protein
VKVEPGIRVAQVKAGWLAMRASRFPSAPLLTERVHQFRILAGVVVQQHAETFADEVVNPARTMCRIYEPIERQRVVAETPAGCAECRQMVRARRASVKDFGESQGNLAPRANADGTSRVAQQFD